MIINSYNVEFGYELISCVPYAYWLHKQKKLKETISGKGSKSLYYFSPKHTISADNRDWDNMDKLYKEKIPNAKIHTHYLDFTKFEIPPYKEYYSNDKYKWDKPTLCICNRYNIEWKIKPINYFSLECLDRLFKKLKDKYQIVYFGVDLPECFQDHAHNLKLGDYEHIKNNHKEIIIFQDLLNKQKSDWNKVMLQVFSNCQHYITMNGGYSILASFFGGQNIIYSKPGFPETQEIKIGSFQRWYPQFADSQIVYVPSYEQLYKKTKMLYIDKKPTVNILIRSCRRENYFHDCMKSILEQTYENINVIVGIEKKDEETKKYVYPYKCRVVHYDKVINEIEKPEDIVDYGIWFPYNHYLDIMTKKVNNGWILYLDDDDKLTNPTVIEELVTGINTEDDLLFWRVDFLNRLVPSDGNWKSMKEGGNPICRDISTIGYMFHSKYSKDIEWGYWKRGDYRVAKKLNEVIPNKVYLDKTYTSIQTGEHSGVIIDKNPVNKESVLLLFTKTFSIYEIGKTYKIKNKWALVFIQKGIAILVT
jgi:hypothetical protein